MDIEFVESAGHVDAAVTARGDEATIESRALDRAISGVETHLALDARHAQMSVTRADVELRLARDFHHEVEGTPPDAEIPAGRRELRFDLDPIAHLSLDQREILVDRVADRLDAGLDVLPVPHFDPDVAVARLHPQVGFAGQGIGFGPLVRIGRKRQAKPRQHQHRDHA